MSKHLKGQKTRTRGKKALCLLSPDMRSSAIGNRITCHLLTNYALQTKAKDSEANIKRTIFTRWHTAQIERKIEALITM